VVKTITWYRDSHGLFDYEQKTSLAKDSFSLNGPTKFVRAESSQVVTVDEYGDKLDGKRLAALNYSDGEDYSGAFSLLPAEQSSEGAEIPRDKFDKMFLVVKFLRQSGSVHGYRLCEGDVLRIGRAKFRVMEINGEQGINQTGLQDFHSLVPNEEEGSEEAEDEEEETGAAPCRVCLSDKTSADNPMLAPCNCAGTMRLIHLKCLQQWLRSRLATKASANVVSFSWKSLDCELCKKSFPSRVTIEGKVIDLMDIPKPEGRYFILEGLSKDRNSPKSLHVVSMMNKTELKMGRGHESEIRISDISASRCHASVRLVGGKFYIDDENSKFGTLVQVKRPLSLELMEEVTVQIGRTVMTLTLKRPWRLIPACFRPASSPFDAYNTTSHTTETILLPINTGIPLSCSDPQELLAYLNPRAPVKGKSHEHRNLMHNHNQIGAYSSCDEAENPGELEEVEVFTSLDQLQRSEEPMSLDRALPSEDLERSA
jgi:hypothetical protein